MDSPACAWRAAPLHFFHASRPAPGACRRQPRHLPADPEALRARAQPPLRGGPPGHLAAALAPVADGLPEALALRHSDRQSALKVGHAALVGGLGQGSCFGLAFALNNVLRARGNPAVKVAAGLVPVVAGYLTAPSEALLREALHSTATLPPQPSLAHDAIAPALLFAVNATYIRASAFPKPAPHTAAGAAVTFALSVAGSGLAGGASEAASQWAWQALPEGDTTQPPARVPTWRKGVGRALSLVPMAVFNQVSAAYVTHCGKVPPCLALVPIGVATSGWTLRRVLMPMPPESASGTTA